MPYYHWKGLNKLGESRKGARFAKSIENLKEILLEEEVALISCKEKAEKKKLAPLPTQKINTQVIANFFENLSIFLDSQIPLVNSLELTRLYTKNKKLHTMIGEMIHKLECGLPFSRALVYFTPPFSALMINLVRSGEHSGHLGQTVKMLAEHMNNKIRLNQKLKRAALLPTITLIFSLGVITIITVFILPHFAPYLLATKTKLPGTIKFFLSISNVFQTETSRLIAAITLLATLVGKRYLPQHIIPQTWKEAVVLRTPFVKQIVITKNLIYFTQTLSLLLKTGTPLQPAIILASEVVTTQKIKLDVKQLGLYLEQGQSLQQAFDMLNSPYFPNSFTTACSIGAETEKLELMLEKTGTILEGNLNRTLHTLTTLFQPTLILILGLIIGYILLSFYMPIFNATFSFS